jgi:uroporphyrinogen-III synthase
MNLLVTRPAADAEALAAVLMALGHSVSIDPVIDIVPTEHPAPATGPGTVLLFTSANGVRVWGTKTRARDGIVYAVGDHTAAAAREIGFASVESASGDAAALFRRIGATGWSSGTAFLHVRGEAVQGDLVGSLRQSGFAAEEYVAYRAQPCASLAQRTCDDLAEARLDGVLLYSARTAGHFTRLVAAAGRLDMVDRIVAYCLSQAVADACRALNFARLAVAPQPTQAALVALLTSPA